jgi:Predicted transcriptional regulators
MNKRSELLEIDCPVSLAQKILGGKWKLVLVWKLKDGPKRFSELLRLLPEIKQSTLTQQLRDLEEDRIIVRKIYEQIPPKVEYFLTDSGNELLTVIYALGKWGSEYKNYLRYAE